MKKTLDKIVLAAVICAVGCGVLLGTDLDDAARDAREPQPVHRRPAAPEAPPPDDRAVQAPVPASAVPPIDGAPPRPDDPAPSSLRRSGMRIEGGKVIVENHPVTVAYPDGRVEVRYARVVATPTLRPMKTADAVRRRR